MVLWGIRSGLAVIHLCGEQTPRSDYPKGSGNPANGVPQDGPAERRDDGIAYTVRAAGQQSTQSTQTPGVMPRTRGRGAGEGGHNLTGAEEAANRKGISPRLVEPHRLLSRVR